eukprot:3829470-Rhodomonas_salina.1
MEGGVRIAGAHQRRASGSSERRGAGAGTTQLSEGRARGGTEGGRGGESDRRLASLDLARLLLLLRRKLRLLPLLRLAPHPSPRQHNLRQPPTWRELLEHATDRSEV